jgi:hypothetical protein
LACGLSPLPPPQEHAWASLLEKERERKRERERATSAHDPYNSCSGEQRLRPGLELISEEMGYPIGKSRWLLQGIPIEMRLLGNGPVSPRGLLIAESASWASLVYTDLCLLLWGVGEKMMFLWTSESPCYTHLWVGPDSTMSQKCLEKTVCTEHVCTRFLFIIP